MGLNEEGDEEGMKGEVELERVVEEDCWWEGKREQSQNLKPLGYTFTIY